MIFNDVKPIIGYDYIPPVGTVPAQVIMSKMQEKILKMLAENGCKYEGETDSDGVRHGHGRILYFDGTVYDGLYDHGMRYGQGTETKRDGFVYCGNWENDMKHGKGQLTLPSKAVITTTWVNGRMHGQGTIKQPNGQIERATYFNDLEIK